MPIYNKLVRDGIPEVIKNEGRGCVVKTIDDREALKLLSEKIIEEANEFSAKPSMEEMADMLEVLYAIMKKNEWDPAEVERVRLEKVSKRGGFEKNVFLVEAD